MKMTPEDRSEKQEGTRSKFINDDANLGVVLKSQDQVLQNKNNTRGSSCN